MKKLITALALSAFAFIGTAVEADARPGYGGNGYSAPSSQIYVSGYRHGRPVYTEKIYVGRDRHGHPVFRYRTVSAPSRGGYGSGYGGGHDHCDSNNGYDRDRRSSGYYDNRSRSGASVSFSFGR